MNANLSSGFQAGSGADPGHMKLVILSLCAGVILSVFAWIVARLIEGYREDEVTQAEATGACVMVVVALSTLFSFLALL